MAWRIEKAVVRGEIDNTVSGKTTGRIWLAGREAPLELDLEGDCWRDIAGSRLAFENPNPAPDADASNLAIRQEGLVGDMTASRKCRIPDPGADPCRWDNILYLEWFSEINGRVVIEAAGFNPTITPHKWTLDEDDEEAQKLANLSAMRDFMGLVIQRGPVTRPGDESSAPLDEFAWEELLKESDRLSDAYQEVIEKYTGDTDCERKEAFVMGWDGLLNALAERDEVAGDWLPDDEEPDEEDFGEDDGPGQPPADAGIRHPLHVRACEIAARSMNLADSGDTAGSPGYELVDNLLTVSGKLGSILADDSSTGHHPEPGFVLAVLKRCLNWLNIALGSCRELHATATGHTARQDFEQLHADIHALRDDIVALRAKFRHP